jgi:hypothetical protein
VTGSKLWAVFPATLVVVASIQVTLAQHADLVPWKGGGFGMFSTVDSPFLRVLNVSLQTSEGRELPVDVGGGHSLVPPRTVARALLFPTRRNLGVLASRLQGLDSWSVGLSSTGDSVARFDAPVDADVPVLISGLKLWVDKPVFDADRKTLTHQIVSDTVVVGTYR